MLKHDPIEGDGNVPDLRKLKMLSLKMKIIDWVKTVKNTTSTQKFLLVICTKINAHKHSDLCQKVLNEKAHQKNILSLIQGKKTDNKNSLP